MMEEKGDVANGLVRTCTHAIEKRTARKRPTSVASTTQCPGKRQVCTRDGRLVADVLDTLNTSATAGNQL